MKYVSIDIETTGLDKETCSILAIGAVVVDTNNPNKEEYPEFYLEVLLEGTTIVGEPIALVMNNELIKRNLEVRDEGQVYNKDILLMSFNGFLRTHFGRDKILVAGKNTGSFDIPFIEKEFERVGRKKEINFGHRVLDIGTLFYKHGDSHIPNLKECLERAGINKEVSHNALEDAWDVVDCEMYMRNESK